MCFCFFLISPEIVQHLLMDIRGPVNMVTIIALSRYKST